MRLSERTKERRGRKARSPRARRSAGSLARRNPEAGAHAVSSAGIGGVPGSERVPFDTRKSPPLVAQSRVRHSGEHPVCCLETNGTTPMRSRHASRVSEGRPPSVPRRECSAPPENNVLQNLRVPHSIKQPEHVATNVITLRRRA